MDSSSLLDRPVTLAEILDQDSLQRVCMTFSGLFGMGIAVLDSRGAVMVDIPAAHPLCRRIGTHPRGRDICGSFDELIQASTDVGETPIARHCPCGLRYEMMAIRHQGVMLGRLVYGPFRTEGMDDLDADLVGRLEDADSDQPDEILMAATADLRRMNPQSLDSARGAMRTIGQVMSVIVQNGYARHLTSQIHIAAIQDAYNELQEKNRRLADSLDQLKELDKLKSNFLATVSHELRTPLTSVIGYSEMLIEGLAGDLTPPQLDYVRTIMDKGDQLLQIISEILDISKIESGSVQLSCERTNVGDLVRQVSDAMMPQARRKNIALQYDVPADLPAITADRTKTRQVLLNLFSNAVKFSRERGAVAAVVHAREIEAIDGVRRPGIEIRVSDSGPGVKPEMRQRIFEAFFQGDSSSTRVHGGTGLGLAIVKHLVEAHGGRVWVESPPDEEGAVFIVHLPVTPPPGTPAARSAQERSRLVG